MPIVPVYSKPLVSDQLTKTPQSPFQMPSGSDFGAQGSQQIGQATEGLISTVGKIAIDEKKKAVDTEVARAEAELIKTKNDLFYGTQEKPGVVSLKGQKAFSALEEYTPKWNEQASRIEESLSDEDAKNLFRKFKFREESEFYANTERHTASERQKYEGDVFKSSLDTTRSDLALNYMSPGKIDSILNSQRSVIQSYADRQGASPEMAQNLLNEELGKTHYTAISSMVNNGQDRLASAYFNRYKAELGDRLEPTQKLVKEGSLRGESQRFTDEMDRQNLSFEDQLSKAKSIEEPKLRDTTVERIKSNFALKEEAHREAQKGLFNSISAIVEQTKSRDQIPMEQWLLLDQDARNKIDDRIKMLRKGIEPETSWDDYYNLRQMASYPETRNQFLKINMLDYRNKLADGEFKQLVDLQSSMVNKDGKADPLLDGFRTHSEIVNSTLNEIGVDPTPKPGSSAAKSVNRFRQLVDQQIIVKQEATGKKVSSKDVEEIANQLASKVITDKGWLWDSKKRAFELENPDIADVSVKDIPLAEKQKIEAYLRRTGRAINNETITQFYKAKLQEMIRYGNP